MALEKTLLALVPGESFEGRYCIEAPLGDGGMGLVYRARHIALGRPVALKVLRKQHGERWVSRKRFEREARALGQLVHPNIVAVTDSGVDHGAPFLVMELLTGVDLASRLRSGALPVALACRYALETLDGLAFVHERGLVHRDIKPANIFLEETALGERVKLLDFGLARLVTPDPDAALTRFGEVLGTPVYMAPEQVQGKAADARTDVYAMGLVLYEMLSGKRALAGNELAVLHQKMMGAMPHLSGAALASLDAIIQRATHKEPAQRFSDARAMRDALAAVAEAFGSVGPTELGASSRVARASSPRAARSGVPSRSSGLMRAAAVLVSCLALTAIIAAVSVIYLIESPGGKERRALLQRAFASLLDEGEAPK
jgi:serine/threonine-protein kinase